MCSAKVLMLTTVVLALAACSVLGQARVEYLNQPYQQPSASYIQTVPQLIVPTLVKSVAQPCDVYGQEIAPIVPNYNGIGGFPGFYPGMPGPLPPIILDGDDDDNFHHLLYFLIFAMRNKRCGPGSCNCGGNCGGNCGCYGCYNGGCGCGGNCGGNCALSYGGNCGCGNNCNGGCGNNCGCVGSVNGCSYFPYPFPYALNGCCCGNDNCCGDDTCTCYANGQPNEINLIIRTD